MIAQPVPRYSCSILVRYWRVVVIMPYFGKCSHRGFNAVDFFRPVRERAIPVHPDDLRMLADVRLAGPALQATAAGHIHLADTKSPSSTLVTSSPTASTTPQNSCPGISEGWMRPCAYWSQL